MGTYQGGESRIVGSELQMKNDSSFALARSVTTVNDSVWFVENSEIWYINDQQRATDQMGYLYIKGSAASATSPLYNQVTTGDKIKIEVTFSDGSKATDELTVNITS
jgi:hypothetical protein